MSKKVIAKAKVVARKVGRPRVVARKVGRPRGPKSAGRSPSQNTMVGREMLIDAACELLKTTQPSEISRALIARETGVDPSLIRYYFQNRTTLLIEAARSLTERYGRMLEDATARSDGTPKSLLRERLRALVDLSATYPYFHRLYLEFILPGKTKEARAIREAVTTRALAGYEALLNEGVRQKEFRKLDAILLYSAIVGMSEFYLAGVQIIELARNKPNPKGYLLEEYTDFICDLVLNGVVLRPAGR